MHQSAEHLTRCSRNTNNPTILNIALLVRTTNSLSNARNSKITTLHYSLFFVKSEKKKGMTRNSIRIVSIFWGAKRWLVLLTQNSYTRLALSSSSTKAEEEGGEGKPNLQSSYNVKHLYKKWGALFASL